MVFTRVRTWLLALTTIVAVLLSATATVAAEEDDSEQLRVAVMEVPGGDASVVSETLGEIPAVDVLSHDGFVEEVESRAFDPDGILDNSSDLEWVMQGGGIDLIVDFEEDGENHYRVHFITAEALERVYDFRAIRDPDGSMGRAAASMIRVELQDFVDRQPDVVSAAAAEADADQSQSESEDQSDDESAGDPEDLRQAAAEDEAARREAFSREWLWVRGHMRLLQKDFSAAAPAAVYTFNSGGFFGYELDVDAFPFSPFNPDLASAGFYANFNHGLYNLTVVDETPADPEDHEQYDVSVNNLTLEGGALYRLDSPLEGSNQQLRFKLGGRHESFSVTENPEIASTSMTSLVVGTRLVLPVVIDEVAVTASADATPVAFFSEGAELFGAESFSYGFGAELGMLFEVMDGGYLSGGYSFRMTYSDFDGESEEDFGDGTRTLAFENTDVFDLNHGLRLGFVVEY